MTPEQLRVLIDYDRRAGSMIWRPRASQGWNTRFAGKPALSNLSAEGYLVGRLLGKNYKAHRAAWAIYYGEWPAGMIDHIDGNRSNNRIANLRIVDAIANAQNQKLRSTNTSGEQGISWFARDSKWWVKITAAGRQVHIGFFDDLQHAVVARDAAYKAAGFHKNHGKR